MSVERQTQSKTHNLERQQQTPDSAELQADQGAPVAGVNQIRLLRDGPLAHSTAWAFRQSVLLQTQRTHGNAHVQRALQREQSSAAVADPAAQSADRLPMGICPGCGQQGRGRCADCGQPFQPVQRLMVQRDETSDDPATAAAQEVYDALNWWNDAPRALRALRVTDAGVRARLPDRFRSLDDSDGESIQSYLHGQLDGDDLVQAFALLDAGHTHEPHAGLALALIPMGTRDSELFRLIEGVPLAGRREMERRYNAAFSTIGEGSLRADLKDDLSGSDLQKALVLLERDLTDADKLYFDSVAIIGTHNDSVINRIQSAWQRGPAAFAELERQWNEDVRNQANGGDEVWTAMTLREAMRDELSGEEWELVKAVLDGYEAYQQGQLSGDLPAGDGPADDEQRTRLEDIQIQVANDTLTAATTGGYTGAGTNEEQVFQALTTIRTIWQQRIQRAEQAGDTARATELNRQWEAEQQRLRGIVSGEMDAGTADNTRSRLLLQGNLTPADEVYLASAAYDNDRVISLVTSYWAQGRTDELRRQAGEERRDGETVLRPHFELNFTIPITSGLPWQRMHTMVRPDISNAERGTRRLKLELDEGDSDSDLRRGYDLLLTTGISSELRTAVIERFVAQNCADEQGERATRKFLNYINRVYERSRTCYDFVDLLEPSTDPQDLLTRAEGRMAASESGIFDAVLNDVVSDYDALTGEDTREVAQESLERLRFIAEQSGANPAELEGMMAMAGVESVADLAETEYGAFQSRLEELRQLKQAIADAIATVIELTIETALTIATGGAAAGALLASLSAAVAGMLARELLLGQDYDLVSRENAQQLALIIASHGFGSFGRGIVADVVNPDQLAELSRARAFVQGMLSDAVTQVGVQTIATGLDGRMPSAEDIGARALTVLGSAIGSGASDTISRNLGDHMPVIVRMRTQVVANISQNLISGVAEESGSLLREGVGDLTGADIALRFGRRSANSIASGVVAGVGDVSAEEVAAARQRRAEERALRDGDGEDMDALAHQHGAATGPVHDRAGAASGEPGVISVAPVTSDHNLSVLRLDSGEIIIKICSPVCSRLHMLLDQAQAHIDNEPVLAAYAAQARDIERRLSADPNDHDALNDMDELADSLGSLIDRVGEGRLFGTEDPGTEGAIDATATAPDTAATGGSPGSAPTLDSLISGDTINDATLLRYYEGYCAYKKDAGEEPLVPAEWVRATRGAARQYLDQRLGPGWIDAARGRRRSRPRGEVYVEITPELLRRLPPYPHEAFVGPFPVAEGTHIAIGASEGRGLSGEAIWRAFLTERYHQLPSSLREEFDLAVHHSQQNGTVRVLDQERGLYWPCDATGNPWELHHVRPLEWGGLDVPENWLPVPHNVHRDLDDWWHAFEQMMLAEQRAAFYGGEQGDFVPEVE